MNILTGTVPLFATLPSPEPVPSQQAAQNRALIQAVRAVNAAGRFRNYEVTFQMDRKLRLPVIRIVDRTTNEIVEQVPAEYILQLAKSTAEGEASTVSVLG